MILTKIWTYAMIEYEVNLQQIWHKRKIVQVFVQSVQTIIYIQFHIYLCVGKTLR